MKTFEAKGDVGAVIVAAHEHSRDTREPVTVLFKDKYPVLRAPIVLKPAEGQSQCLSRMTFEGLGSTGIDCHVPEGQAAITLLGWKGGWLNGLALQLKQSKTIGLDVSGSPFYRSSGATEFYGFSCEIYKGCTSCVGMRIGGGVLDGRGDDFSGYVLRNLRLAGWGESGDVETHLRSVIQNRNVGILWQGGNNQSSSIYDVQARDLMVVFDHMGNNPDWPGVPGGKGCVYHGGNVSGCGGVYRIDSGYSGMSLGGRIEDGGYMVVHGAPDAIYPATGQFTAINAFMGGMMPGAAVEAGQIEEPLTIRGSDPSKLNLVGVNQYGLRQTKAELAKATP